MPLSWPNRNSDGVTSHRQTTQGTPAEHSLTQQSRAEPYCRRWCSGRRTGRRCAGCRGSTGGAHRRSWPSTGVLEERRATRRDGWPCRASADRLPRPVLSVPVTAGRLSDAERNAVCRCRLRGRAGCTAGSGDTVSMPAWGTVRRSATDLSRCSAPRPGTGRSCCRRSVGQRTRLMGLADPDPGTGRARCRSRPAARLACRGARQWPGSAGGQPERAAQAVKADQQPGMGELPDGRMIVAYTVIPVANTADRLHRRRRARNSGLQRLTGATRGAAVVIRHLARPVPRTLGRQPSVVCAANRSTGSRNVPYRPWC